MSRKKYWLDITIQTRSSSAQSFGSYRTKAFMVSVYSKHLEIRKRRIVDLALTLLEGLVNALSLMGTMK